MEFRVEAHDLVNRLVEADFDRRELMERLGRFSQTHDPQPLPPDEFENLAAFLNFYEAKRRYETERQSLKNQRDVAEESYNQAVKMLRDILPENTPLHYYYEGTRQDLAGVRFTIVNRHIARGRSQIEIASSRPPSQ